MKTFPASTFTGYVLRSTQTGAPLAAPVERRFPPVDCYALDPRSSAASGGPGVHHQGEVGVLNDSLAPFVLRARREVGCITLGAAVKPSRELRPPIHKETDVDEPAR